MYKSTSRAAEYPWRAAAVNWKPRLVAPPARSWPTQYEYQIFGHNCNCNFLLAVYLAALIDCAAAAVPNPPDKSTRPPWIFITVGENEKFMPIFRTLRGAGRRVARPGRLSWSGDNTVLLNVLQAKRACNKVKTTTGNICCSLFISHKVFSFFRHFAFIFWRL